MNQKRAISDITSAVSHDDDRSVAIDFTDEPDDCLAILSLPGPQDTLEVFIKKLVALADVVSKNSSLAVWTGFAATPRQQRNPLAIAKAEARPREAEYYRHFEESRKRGFRPKTPSGDFDLCACTKPLERENKKTARRYEDMASCVDEVFGTNGATKENVCWVVVNMEWALPLFKFLLRVKRARRSLSGGQSAITSSEMAEYQTVRKIRSALGLRTQALPGNRLALLDVHFLRRQDKISKILRDQGRHRVESKPPVASEQPTAKRQCLSLE